VTGEARTRKDALRATILAARRGITAGDRARAEEAIAVHGLAAWRDLRTVAAYLSFGTEPPTVALLDRLTTHNVRILLPVIDGDRLDWAVYAGTDSIASGPLGIREPTGVRLGVGAVADADVVVVPALAVDALGNRLGRGRGYYDRALAEVSAIVVAVVYDEELIDDVPSETHDRRVDAILRPAGLSRSS